MRLRPSRGEWSEHYARYLLTRRSALQTFWQVYQKGGYMTKRIQILVVLVVMAFVMHASAETVEMRGEVVDATFQIAPFTWTAQNFAGLYYDVDRNLMSGALTTTAAAPDTINCGDLVYTAYRVESGYANPDIGGYFAVGWFGEKCMAINGKPYVLSPIIREMDADDKIILATGEGWDIGNEYHLIVREIDIESDRVWLALEKDDVEVEAAVIQPMSQGDCFDNSMSINGSPGAYTVEMADVSTTSTFVYQKDIDMEDDVPIFSVYVDAIFRGTDTNIVILKYAILIDDDLVKVVNGGVGMLDVDAVTSESIRLSSDRGIRLPMDSDVNIAEGLWLHVADDMDNDGVRNYRYYPYLLYECASSGSTPPPPPPPPPPLTTEIFEGMLYAGQGIEIEHDIRIELVGTSSYPVESANFKLSSYQMPESLITISPGDSSTEPVYAYRTSGGEIIYLNVALVSGDSVYLVVTAPEGWRVTDRYTAKVDKISIRGEVVEPTGEESMGIVWNASDFAALGYDLDCDAATETLAIVPGTLSHNDRTIDEGDIEYGTSARGADFEYGAWGSYRTISFMAEDYLAEYGEGTDCAITDGNIRLISKGMLSKVLINEDERRIIASGVSLQLEEGYELKIVQLDFYGGQVQLELLRNGQSVDTDILNVPDTFVYVNDLGKLDDVPVIAANIDSISTGQPDMVAIDGIFQISEEYISVENGDVYGKMVIGGVSGDGIAMANAYPIYLSRGNMIHLMGNIGFAVADNETLRFSPAVTLTAPGTYEVRGAVARPDVDPNGAEIVWNASDFAALWYDFDSDASTETLAIESLNGRVIEDDMLTYTTHPVYQQYAINKAYSDVTIDGATGYNATGWIAGKYVAADGRADTLHRLLVEFKGDDKKTLPTGEQWNLGAGFTLTAQQIDLGGSKVWLSFARDGVEIAKDVIDTSHASGSSNQNRTFVAYLEDADGEEEIAVFHCYVDAVFRGTDTNIVQVTHVFLIDNFVTKISNSDIYGAMEVIRADSDKIVLANRVIPTVLEPGSRQRVMGNIYLRTADDETEIRFYPAAEYTIGREEPPGYPDCEV